MANLSHLIVDDFVIIVPASEHSLVLKEINVPLWNHANCNRALQAQFGPAYTLPSSAICAGAEGRDACDVSTSKTSLICSVTRSGNFLGFGQVFEAFGNN